jgi:hypothetical protein
MRADSRSPSNDDICTDDREWTDLDIFTEMRP